MGNETNYIRHGMGAVRPYLYGNLELPDFLKEVFGAEVVESVGNHSSGYHVEMRLADSVFVVETGEKLADGPRSQVYDYVEDPDATYDRRSGPGALPSPRPRKSPTRSGRVVFIAGQVALDRTGILVGKGDMEAQARQVFENLKAALESCGATFANVVKLTIFTVDVGQLPAVRKVRDQYINTAQPPASTAAEVRKLFREDILIEIEAVAAIPA